MGIDSLLPLGELRKLAAENFQRAAISKAPRINAASLGVRNLALAVARLASEGIDFSVQLYGLHHNGKACSLADDARMLCDLWHGLVHE